MHFVSIYSAKYLIDKILKQYFISKRIILDATPINIGIINKILIP